MGYLVRSTARRGGFSVEKMVRILNFIFGAISDPQTVFRQQFAIDVSYVDVVQRRERIAALTSYLFALSTPVRHTLLPPFRS